MPFDVNAVYPDPNRTPPKSLEPIPEEFKTPKWAHLKESADKGALFVTTSYEAHLRFCKQCSPSAGLCSEGLIKRIEYDKVCGFLWGKIDHPYACKCNECNLIWLPWLPDIGIGLARVGSPDIVSS